MKARQAGRRRVLGRALVRFPNMRPIHIRAKHFASDFPMGFAVDIDAQGFAKPFLFGYGFAQIPFSCIAAVTESLAIRRGHVVNEFK